MDEMTRFEQRFEERVRKFALTGVRPVDSAAMAHAVAVWQPRGRGAGTRVRWLGSTFDRRAWTIAIALGLLVAILGGVLLIGARLLVPPDLDASLPDNGWIAFTVSDGTPENGDPDTDIWFVGLDQGARRVVGTDTDRVHQLCPAFSPDGRSLAYGRVEGQGTDYFMNEDGTEGAVPAAYEAASLVVADVADEGTIADRLTFDVGDGLPPPCPVWSPDGDRLAFGVPRTSPINPLGTGEGSEVWVVRLSDRDVTMVPDLLATDLEWSPDGSLLAIAGGVETASGAEVIDGLQDARIHLYAPSSGSVRSLDDTLGVSSLTWAPDGRRLAYTGRGSQLYVLDVETGRQTVIADQAGSLHGIGPVWSPDGELIAFQRGGFGGEHSEVVLVTPGVPPGESAGAREAVVPVTARGSSERMDPYRVTWSPDGQDLLMMAWGVPPDSTTGVREGAFLVAIPVNPALPTVVLSRIDGLVPYDGYPDTTLVPIQTWGRQPSGPSLRPTPTPQPDETPSPDASESGQLIVNLQTWSADPAFVEVAVYADGRVIWVADERVGFVTQRLTAEGVERLRSRALSAGLFDSDLALGIDGLGWGNVTVDRGDRSVIVAWGSSPVNVSGLDMEDRFVPATSAQSAEVSELEAFLRDPVTWGFPGDVYVQREITPFVPSHLYVGFDRSVPDYSDLPSRARELLTRVSARPDCELISIDEAEEIAQALADAGILEPGYEVRRGFAFTDPGSESFVHLHPALPHDVAACSEG